MGYLFKNYTTLIISQCLEKAISNEFFKINDSIDSTIYNRFLSNFQQCEWETLFSIYKSDVDPGHFSWLTIYFEKLLKNEQVIEIIKEKPEK